MTSLESVREYVAHVDEPWRGVVERLRAECLENLGDCEEIMAYGMPTYRRNGRTEVAFARQAKYLSLYIRRRKF